MTPETTTAETKKLLSVVLRAYKKPFTLQSNYFRRHATYVAMASSMGLISTRVWGVVFGQEWRATMKGLGFLSVHLGEEFVGNMKMDWGHNE